MKEVRAFVISRKVWLRGEGGGYSALFRPKDKKRCCLGLYLEACGRDLRSLATRMNPADLRGNVPGWLLSGSGNSDACRHLIEQNDARDIPESNRERWIAAGFAKAGIKVTFED
jgi:hypothetical protein